MIDGGYGPKNNVFDTMTDGDERTAFDIDPDAVDRAQKSSRRWPTSLQWLSADIDEIEKSLPKADKNPQRVDQLGGKPTISGGKAKLWFPFGSRLVGGLHLVMISQDGPLSREGADLTRCGLLSKGGRRASGTRRRAKPPMTQFFKSKFLMTDRDAEYH